MLIAFEGLPGAGKTTQSRLVAERMTASGTPAALLPDLTHLATDPLGTDLVELFASSSDPFMRHGDIVTDTYLAAAIRTNLTAAHITPALEHHQVVIEDRGVHTLHSYSLATLVQRHRADPAEVIPWLRAVTTLTGRTADLALWLREPIHDAIRRATRRDGRLLTAEQQSYLHHVNEAYTELTRHDPTLLAIETTGRDAADVHEAVVHALASHGAWPPEPAVPARPAR